MRPLVGDAVANDGAIPSVSDVSLSKFIGKLLYLRPHLTPYLETW